MDPALLEFTGYNAAINFLNVSKNIQAINKCWYDSKSLDILKQILKLLQKRISAIKFHLCMKKPQASEAKPKSGRPELSGRD